MGFWSRDRADQLLGDSFPFETFAYLDRLNSYLGMLPSPGSTAELTLVCTKCQISFLSDIDLTFHNENRHLISSPLVFLFGKEIVRERTLVTELTEPEHWQFAHVEEIKLNGQMRSEVQAKEFLASQTRGNVLLELKGRKKNWKTTLEFDVASAEILDEIDELFYALMKGRVLNRSAISSFQSSALSHKRGLEYVDGLVDYLYGAYYSDKLMSTSKQSDLESTSINHIDLAALKLSKYNRDPAEIICGLIAFSYNQFERASGFTFSPLVSHLALTFRRYQRGNIPNEGGPILSSRQQSREAWLTDRNTQFVFDHCSSSILSELDDLKMLPGFESLPAKDKSKLVVRFVEEHICSGDFALAERASRLVRHDPDWAIWSARLPERLKVVHEEKH